MSSSEHLQGFGRRTVASDVAVVVAISAHQVGQQLRVAGVRFRSRYVVTVAVAGGSHGVDGVDLVAGRHQCGHDQPSVLFDADDHIVRLIVLTQVLGGERM